MGYYFNLIDPRWWCLKKKFILKFSGEFSEINNENGYVIAIVTRGEQLLYEDVIGAVTLNISLSGCWVQKPLEYELCSAERIALILNRVESYFENYQGISVQAIDCH
jgi:hypothetical protein